MLAAGRCRKSPYDAMKVGGGVCCRLHLGVQLFFWDSFLLCLGSPVLGEGVLSHWYWQASLR